MRATDTQRGRYAGSALKRAVDAICVDVARDELSESDLLSLAERVGNALHRNRSREDQLRRSGMHEEANKIYLENKEEARRIFQSGGISAGEFDRRLQKMAGRSRLNVKMSRLFGDAAHDKLPFDAWMKEVDSECQRRSGVSVHDLPDCPFADWHERGVSPAGAAGRCIKAAKSDM